MVKNIITNIKDVLKKNIENFPLTNICIIVMTIVTILEMDIDFSNEFIERFYLFFVTLTIGAYFVETKKINKMYYAIPITISIFGVIISEICLAREIERTILKILYTYLISIIIYSIYNNYKNSKKEFAEYVEDIFKGFIKLSLVYGILALSILIIGLIFNFLIIDLSDFELIEKIEILILGIYYISNILYVLKGEDNSESIVIKGLIRKVLTPLVYISFIIIYIYLFKIIISGIEENSDVFYIIAFLFSIDVPILLMSSSYKENEFIDKINRYSSFILIPFIMIQIYALFNETYYRGIEIDTYMWMMIVIFECFYLICSIFKKDYGNLFKIAIIITIITLLCPFINAEDISFYSQYHNLKLYNENTTYNKIQKTRIYNAYQYIKNSEVEEEYFNKLNISEKDIEIIKTFDESYIKEEVRDVHYTIRAKYDGAINIEGYTDLYSVRIWEYNLEKDYIDEITIKYNNTQNKFTFYKHYISYYKNKDTIEKYFKNHNEIILDENNKLILTDLRIFYENDKIKNYDMEGYLLQK